MKNIIAKSSFLFYTLITISCVSGVNIKFYKSDNFTGLFYESNSTNKCNNFPMDKQLDVWSIKTDICLMLYMHTNCRSPHTWKIPPGEAVDRNKIGSFHTCNEDDGGSQLNLDITTYYNYDEPAEYPIVLESYRNVCSCINIPVYVQRLEKWSINNHGNNIVAYFEPNCSTKLWYSHITKAGIGWDSINMHYHGPTNVNTKEKHKIQSLGPRKSSKYFKTNCKSEAGQWKIFSGVYIMFVNGLVRLLPL